jgi:uncharacterized protein with NRDE domain
MAVDRHPEYRLVIAENRDEFFNRPTEAARFWPDAPEVLAGKDLERGGSWFGVTRSGRWAAVTNYRDFHHRRYSRLSRGGLVSRFLQEGEEIELFRQRLSDDDGHYAGLNFIAGDHEQIFYFSNTGGGSRIVGSGVYGLSNHWLETPWPKVVGVKQDMQAWLADETTDIEPIFSLLADRRRAADAALPDTGVGLEWERMLSARFVQGEEYGTRASTVYLVDRQGQARFIEKSFDENGAEKGIKEFRFSLPE